MGMASKQTAVRARKRPEPEDAGAMPEIALDGLGDLIGFHLRMAHAAVYRHFMASLSHLDLTQRQGAVLWLVGANPGTSQIAMANKLGMDRATMMSIVDRLQKRQFLIRRRSKRDGRRQEIYLTPRGQQILVQTKNAIAEHEKWLISRFEKSELATFIAFLRRIHG